jgi:hypothetical protein
MCTYNIFKSIEDREQFIKEKTRKRWYDGIITKKEDFFWGYKIVYNQDGKLYSRYYSNYEWLVGRNKAIGAIKDKHEKEIEYGIHVYTEKYARWLYDGHNEKDSRLIKVKCYWKDLLGMDDTSELAFEQVYLSQEEYDLAAKVDNE